MGPPVPITARVHSTAHSTPRSNRNITSFYGSSCANNGKDALNTPGTLPKRTLIIYYGVLICSSRVVPGDPHGEADVRLLEGAGVVGAVPRHRHHLAKGPQHVHQVVLVCRGRPRHHLLENRVAVIERKRLGYPGSGVA
eukprot:1178232-Prorocentrum_minimum.AAC.2